MTQTDHKQSPCCATNAHSHEHEHKRDWIMLGSLAILIITILANAILGTFTNSPHLLHHFAHTEIEILKSMWWGIALGIIIIGLMSKIPKEIFTGIMGKDNTFSGLLRAVFGGLLLDLCCHGILLVAAKLYERGVSFPQVATFLIASPWNSISLTLVLIGLIGLKWTLLYIAGSMLIAIIAGLILQKLISFRKLPDNPNKSTSNEIINLKKELKILFGKFSLTKQNCVDVLKNGWSDGKMIIKWLLFGTIIAASLRTFIPADMFAHWLGPNVLGLFITLIIATIVEICSEGSAPIASEIVTSANAPGNGFTFLMAGVATDYTEFMAIKEFTKSWVIAIAIPLITVPQILLIGYIMNLAATN